MKTWKIILAALVIFTAGVVTGSLVVWNVRVTASGRPPRPPEGFTSPWFIQRPDFLPRVKKDIDLTVQQEERLGVVLKKSRQRTDPLWEMLRPGLQEEFNRVTSEIRAELSSDQQKKFDELLTFRKPKGPPPDARSRERTKDETNQVKASERNQ